MRCVACDKILSSLDEFIDSCGELCSVCYQEIDPVDESFVDISDSEETNDVSAEEQKIIDEIDEYLSKEDSE